MNKYNKRKLWGVSTRKEYDTRRRLGCLAYACSGLVFQCRGKEISSQSVESGMYSDVSNIIKTYCKPYGVFSPVLRAVLFEDGFMCIDFTYACLMRKGPVYK